MIRRQVDFSAAALPESPPDVFRALSSLDCAADKCVGSGTPEKNRLELPWP